MGEIRVIKVKQSVLANNDRRAEELRNELKRKSVFLINLMSSPGSGKTTLLVNLIKKLQASLRVGVMEADMDATVDAETVSAKTGCRTIQLHTSGECHLDAKMTSEGIEELNPNELDLVILENIGNLVCPAEFDTGANLKMVLLSIPEGDDKPLKYPLMFTKGDVFVFTKMDAKAVFDFDVGVCSERIKKLNPEAIFFPVSAKKDEGVQALADYIISIVKSYQESNKVG